MVNRRVLALCGLVSLALLYSCVDGSSPVDQGSPGRAFVALSTSFPEGTTAEQVADITRIRVTVKRVSDDSAIGTFVTEVDPNLAVWAREQAPEVRAVPVVLPAADPLETTRSDHRFQLLLQHHLERNTNRALKQRLQILP